MGLYEIGSLSTFMYQKDVLKIEPQTMQMLIGILAIPWCIKPVFGYICDDIIHRVKKVKYIIICSALIRFVLFTVLAHVVGISAPLFYSILFINSMCSLTENILSEYILVVSTKREHEQNPDSNANHLPIFFGFRAAGSLIGNFFGGRIIHHHGIATNFLISSMFPLIVICFAMFYQERPVGSNQAKKSLLEELDTIKQLLFRDKVLQMMLFIFFINLTPNFDVLFTFYLTDYLKLSMEDLSNFSTFATMCYIIGLFCYSFYLNRIDPKKFYIATNFALWIINLSFLAVVTKVLDNWGWDKRLFCMLSQGVYSFVAELNYMPILGIWCAVCPKNLEATSITLFTGLMNMSGNLSNYIGAFLMWVLNIHKENFDKMWIPVVIQSSYLLVAMMCVVCVKFPDPRTLSEEKADVTNELQPVEIVD